MIPFKAQKNTRLIPSIFVCYAVLSCSATIIRHSGSFTFDRNNTPLTCALLPTEFIDIYYKESVRDVFGEGNKNLLIGDFLRERLKKEITERTVFDRVWNTFVLIDYKQLKEWVKTGDGEKAFKIPMAGQVLRCQGGIPDIAIILQNIEITSDPKRDKQSPSDSPDTGSKAGPAKSLKLKTTFVMWDNQSSERISFGYIEVTQKNGTGITKEDWIAAVARTAEKMLNKTPFQKES
ncbi:MAG: hypothetical protein JXA18_14265 [Chitinispirillaceae bacterium]|nr:hypothetical protein [Chitinispirillaceae bacterium]